MGLDNAQYQARKRVIRAAKLANQEVGYSGYKVYVNGVLAYDPDAPPPVSDAEHEDEAKLWMYGEALKDLAAQDRRYSSNASMWHRWDNSRRLWWIEHAEAQAEMGLQTIGAAVVARAVEIRLTRTKP